MDSPSVGIGQDSGKGKAPRGRRSWTRVEEDALIHCLTDIVNDGWKVENGFKAGFQRELEKLIRKLLPGTDIVDNPHINSKTYVWKKEYSALSDLLSKSGIGWNSTTSMIDVEDESVWDSCSWVKGSRHKTWPYYASWIDSEQGGEIEENHNPTKPIGVNKAETNSVCKPECLEFMKQSQEIFGDIAKGLGTSNEKRIDPKHMTEIMNRIVGLQIADKLKVCDELVPNPNRLELFLSLPVEAQDEFVWMLLDGRL
ncbi:hypothetical protein ACS0TY_026339 [Phlomoides rotata]